MKSVKSTLCAIALMAAVPGVMASKPHFNLAKNHVSAPVVKAATGIPAKTAYAWATRDRGNVATGIVSFSLNNPGSLTSLYPLANRAYAGCYANGKYYFDRYRTYTENGESTWAHIALSTVDLATGAVTDIKDWSDEIYVINDMTYDYTRNTIYAMARNYYQDDFLAGFGFEYSCLLTINPNTGVINEVKQFIDWGNGALTNPTYFTLACDLNGTLYAVDKNGYLVTFDRDNDYAEVTVGFTGVYPGQSTQSMEFDHSTGALYWCADYSSNVADLQIIDTVSGLAQRVGETGTDAHLVGLYIPFNVPSAAAPGAVTGFTATPDATGARSITLAWTNPTKSFGGQNLASISSVKVLRDEALIATLTPAAPGAAMTYTDAPETSGNHTYSVVAVNAAGNGLVSGITRWVGKDVPMAPANVGVGMNDNGGAYLCWEAPTSGVHGGLIDESTLGYKIVRFPDGTVVADDLRATECNDNTIPGMGRYYYTIEAHTADGVGESAKSVEIALGSGVVSFPWNTLFADKSEFNLWTVVDNNGGSTWSWKSRTAGGYTSYAMYTYDNANTADDYLVSPDLYLKKGARYKVTFACSGSNANYTEKLEVTFGQGATAEAQSEVLASYELKSGDVALKSVELPEIAETGIYNFAFHAMSAPKQYNIYVTDVTVSMTVAPADDDDDDYDFIAPTEVRASVDTATSSVTLDWGKPETPATANIFEDFEDMPKWTINPEGKYGWNYIDGDKGIPYRSDYYDMPYPTDGTPLAAMVMAPYELGEEIYLVNPPYSGEQYLLFKSNFSQGDGSRPAPKPDDWFISPELNFNSDFIFRFFCKADPDYEYAQEGFDDLWNTEQFRVGYSTTGMNPDDFVWMTDANERVTTNLDEWVKKEYSMPADAKYVCIHYCTPEDGYWFMVDDVFIGVETPAANALAAPAAKTPTFRHYEVVLDDVVKAVTTETSHTLTSVPVGSHVAKIVAVYEEGRAQAVAVPFVIEAAGIENVAIDANDAVEVYNLQGVKVADSLQGLSHGVYVVKTADKVVKVVM